MRRVVLLLVFLVALSVAEEFAAGWIHGRSAAETLEDFERRSPLELFATVLLLGLVLVPYVAAKEIDRALAPGSLRDLLSRSPQ